MAFSIKKIILLRGSGKERPRISLIKFNRTRAINITKKNRTEPNHLNYKLFIHLFIYILIYTVYTSAYSFWLPLVSIVPIDLVSFSSHILLSLPFDLSVKENSVGAFPLDADLR